MARETKSLEERYCERIRLICRNWAQRLISREEYLSHRSQVLNEFQRMVNFSNADDTTLIPGTSHTSSNHDDTLIP